MEKTGSGDVAVITGAGRGLGAALSISLADAGYMPVLCGRNPAALSEIAAIIEARTGIAAQAVVLDLANPESVDAAISSIATSYQRIGLLVNNGAMWLEASETPHSSAEVMSTINAAVSGTFLFTQGLLPLLKAAKHADIVTIGSISSLPNATLQTVSVPFYAAKQAQASLASGFRQQLKGSTVRSIIVHPPYLDDAIPGQPEWEEAATRTAGQRGTSRDITEAVMFAISRPGHVTLSITVDADEGGLFPADHVD